MVCINYLGCFGITIDNVSCCRDLTSSLELHPVQWQPQTPMRFSTQKSSPRKKIRTEHVWFFFLHQVSNSENTKYFIIYFYQLCIAILSSHTANDIFIKECFSFRDSGEKTATLHWPSKWKLSTWESPTYRDCNYKF